MEILKQFCAKLSVKQLNKLAIFAMLSLALSACASTSKTQPTDNSLNVQTSSSLEQYNQDTYRLNSTVDKYFLKPIAQFYVDYTPKFTQDMVHNFFSNFNYPHVIVNDALQFDVYWFASDSWRLLINTTVGIGGLFDPASHIGLPAHSNDMGLVFAKWGWTDSSYFVIPFWGPSTVRDAIGLPFDLYAFSFWPWIPAYVGYPLAAADAVDYRASFLDTTNILDAGGLDPYTFQKSAYMQHRSQRVQQITTGENLPQQEQQAAIDSDSGYDDDLFVPEN